MNPPDPISLRQFLLAEHERHPDAPRITAAMEDIAQATRKISHLVSRGQLGGMLGSAGTANVQGETQKRLDVIANDVMLESLASSDHWIGLASEEMEHSLAVATESERGYLCLFDPLDGSSNIDINGSIGTIFSILRCPTAARRPQDHHFLQPGTEQVAAGFTLYGPATVLVLTTGHGVNGFTLDRGTGEYLLTRADMRIPEDTEDFSVNMSNRGYWATPMRDYVDECMRGSEGERGKHFNMRWVGSMVADVYRVLCQGGIFLYPWDSRDPGKPGKLRLMYEANPMSFIVEQAGGASSTGLQRILDIQPKALHERCPVALGSRHEVQRVVACHRSAMSQLRGVTP
jgi:fructose-1,6-bisphosphatase I